MAPIVSAAQLTSQEVNMSGLFITFEGGEGAGKTTLIDQIASALEEEGLSVLKVREPGGTKLGEEVRRWLLEGEAMSPRAELFLFLASRAEHVAQVILPALKAGKVVLCDRFNESSIAYQGAGRKLGMDKVAELGHFAAQGLQPKVILYLDVSPEVGLKRAAKVRAKDRMEKEVIEFHQIIREAFLQLCKEGKNMHKINAEMRPEQVFEEAMRYISPYV